MTVFQSLFENRDLWSIGVYRYDRLEDIFCVPPVALAHFHGESGLRVGKNYQSVAADPFLFAHDGLLYLFYEVKTDHAHGTIHAQSMLPDGRWQVHGPVLVEPFHLSYPQVFALGGRIFMLPEAAQSGTVRLYEAEDFPTRWRHCSTLIDSPLRDPTVLAAKDDYILLLGTTADYKLKLYHAPAIDHPFTDLGFIVTQDRRFARGAGGILNIYGQFLRPAQDCSGSYGKCVNFQCITKFSSYEWLEHPSGLNLHIPPARWRSRGSHHISCEKFGDSLFVAIDGRGPDRVINSWLLGIMRLAEKCCHEASVSSLKSRCLRYIKK